MPSPPKRRLLFSVLFAACLPLQALRAQTGPDLAITDAWSRPAPVGQVGGAYLTLAARQTADQLTGLSSPIAGMVELHQSYSEGGVEKMRPVPALPITPGQPVTLAPGGYHIMLMGLTRALAPGETFPLTLHFDKAGDITVTVTVQPFSYRPKAAAPAP